MLGRHPRLRHKLTNHQKRQVDERERPEDPQGEFAPGTEQADQSRNPASVGPQNQITSGGSAFVAMMDAAEYGDRHDLAVPRD